jgi:hypothetical protein
MLIHFCTQIEGSGVSTSLGRLALEFGLLRMVRQPSAECGHSSDMSSPTQSHPTARPQTILKFRPPSSLDYRTHHGSQSSCLYYALQITFRLSPVQIVNFLCPIDEISVIRASIEHKKLTI